MRARLAEEDSWAAILVGGRGAASGRDYSTGCKRRCPRDGGPFEVPDTASSRDADGGTCLLRHAFEAFGKRKQQVTAGDGLRRMATNFHK